MSAKVREIVPGIFIVHLPLPMRPTIVNVHLVCSGDEWALIDTGVNSRESIAAFKESLALVGCAPEQIKKIICTHHHPDHFGTSKTYKELTGAVLYLHRAEYERSHTFAPAVRPAGAMEFFRTHGVPVDQFTYIPSPHEFWSSLYVPTQPDVFIEDGDTIRVGDIDIEVVWTPGHAPGHCVMYLPRRKIMIVGDHLLPKITPHVGLFPGTNGNPLADFIDSQRKVQRYEVGLVLPAHGGPFTDHRHRANQIIQHHALRLQEILDLLKKRPRTAYDVAAHVFSFNIDSSIAVQFPATFETLAHLEYLRRQGTVERIEQEGRALFHSQH
jgi:glyoxylase-like metal-dependent hydrolase (beta-lactamase superfamily II)